MRAFITGGSGFIGGHLIRALIAAGWSIRALVHDSPLETDAGIETIRGDIREPGSWSQALRGTDVLFHLAAVLGFSRLSEAEFVEINARGTGALYKAAVASGVRRVVHVSSAGVIGSVRPGDVAAEDYPPNPRTVYDRSKREAERIAIASAGSELPVVVVRPGWTYGPGDRRTFKVIKAIHDRRFLVVAPRLGRQTPVYIDDLVSGLRLAAGRGKSGEIYHLAGNEILTVKEMAETIAGACGVRLPRISLPHLPATLAAWALQTLYTPLKKEAPLNLARLSFFVHPKAISSDKARRELGFSPSVDFKSGMASTVAWYREHNWL